MATTGAEPPPPRPPDPAASAGQAEALRHKSVAEQKYLSSDFKSALKHAKKAHRLTPPLAGVPQLVAALRVLRTPSSDHYRTLRLEPFSHINSIKHQYKSLALLLHPDKSSSDASNAAAAASEEAFKRVSESFSVLSDRVRRKEYDTKLRIELQAEKSSEEKGGDGGAAVVPVETFWTACATCRLYHQFDRRYVRQRLVCPSCRKSFLAVEVKTEDGADAAAPVDDGAGGARDRTTPSRSRSSTRTRTPTNRWVPDSSVKRKAVGGLPILGPASSPRPTKKAKEPTLAEMQREALRMKSKGHILKVEEKEVESRERRKERNRRRVARIWAEEEEKDEGLSVMAVEDSDFFDFDKDRVEKSFRKGQVWAIYDDDDGMPRHYGLINEVISTNPFRLKMSWLDLHGNGEESLAMWENMGFHISCGRFKVGKKVDVDSINMFSHVTDCERAAKELYRIYPKKGSVWALYSERTLGGGEERFYDIVVFLTSYSEVHGLSMAYLDKVEGFKTVFNRREIGLHAVKWLEKDDFRLFSHQIPARKLSSSEGPGLPKECWELDPASLSADMLCITSG